MIITARIMLALGVLLLSFDAAHAFSWAPINPEELRMTAEPKAPGAAAIILELQFDRDDWLFKISKYIRIKVLTEEGRRFGDLEIPYEKNGEYVRYIEARTIHSDGKITEFNGTIFDKLIVKGKGIKYQAKTFAMPDVQVGSIIEYRYVVELPSRYIFDSKWIICDELFIKHAKYSFMQNPDYRFRSTWPDGLPPGVSNPIMKGGKVLLETNNVAAFVSEDYMPPAEELKYHVDFVYYHPRNEESEPTKFWQEYAKENARDAENFMSDRKAMTKVIAELISANDSDEMKLRKIYAHVQSLRNLSYEIAKSAQEQERDKIKSRRDVADVEKYSYGNSTDLTYLFIALARAAGFKSDYVLVSTRNHNFFLPSAMNPNDIRSNVALVTVGSKEYFAEPGVPFVPFGLLPWYESGVVGLRVDAQGGGWVKTPVTTAVQSKTMHKGAFKIDDGSLVGTVVVTYTGLDALDHRLDVINEDATARKEYMQNEMKRAIAGSSEVTMINSPDWTGADTPLVVEFKIKVPEWATAVRKRTLIPIGLFGTEAKHIFEHEHRVHPIYFHYPASTEDDISIELPTGSQVVSMPQARDENVKFVTFSSSTENSNGVLRIKRNLTTYGVIVQEKYYLALRDFFRSVRSNDEEQVVLVPVATSAASSEYSSTKAKQ